MQGLPSVLAEANRMVEDVLLPNAVPLETPEAGTLALAGLAAALGLTTLRRHGRSR